MNLDLSPNTNGQPIRQWAFNVIRKNIIDLLLKPGQFVSESEIAAVLKISRTPVREAFIRLAEEGIMEIHPQRGSMISFIDLDQAEESHFLRCVLEKAVTQEACERLSEDALFELRANLELQKLCNTEKNYHRMLKLDDEFHGIIYRGCNKERTWHLLKKSAYNLDRLRILYLSYEISWDELIKEHIRLVQVIENKDTKEIDPLVERHIRKTRLDAIEDQISKYVVRNA